MLKRLFLLLLTGFLFQQSFAQDALLLKTPSDGQIISGGDYIDITWERSNVENIKIEYSLDNGTTWVLIIDSYAAQAGKYPWLVPAKPTTKGKIRISDIDNNSIASINSGSFTISEPQLSLDMDTTSTIVRGNAFRIGWKSLSVEKVNLYYSIDGGSNYKVIRKDFPALASSFTWIVPPISSDKISLKVESVDSAAINGIWKNASVASNIIPAGLKYQGGSFDGHSSTSNTNPKLSLAFPLGNEDLASSSTQTIRWSSSNIEYLKVEFSSDNGVSWKTINDSYSAYAKKLDWVVPTSMTSNGFIRLTSVEDAALTVTNLIPFKIPLKSIAIAESFEKQYSPQQPIQISWVNNGVNFVSLHYRTPATEGWKTITKSVSAQLLNYIWITPANFLTDSLQFKIRATDESVQDSSETLLSIRTVSNSSSKFRGGSYDGFSQASNLAPVIKLLSPSAEAKLNGFANTSITWKSENIESVAIHFSTDSGKTWKDIIKNYSGNAFKYAWTVPAVPTQNGFIRISSAEDSTISSISDRFYISDGFLKLSSDSVTVGGINTVLPVSWIQSGVSKVNILTRAKTAGTNWTKVVSNYEASAGSYLWIMKQALSGLHSLKIENAGAGPMSDSLDINFNHISPMPTVAKYRGGSYDGHSSRSNVSKILITKPQSGEVLIAGTTYTITWSTVNVSDSVKIEYTTDNGQSWKIISVAVDSKTGTFQWTVPANEISTKSAFNKLTGHSISAVLSECKIRISETGSQDEVVGLSNNTFTISGSTGSGDTPKKNQIVTFDLIPDKAFGDVPFTIRASADSGLPITYSIASGPATLSENTITLTGAGIVKVLALQVGDMVFSSASATREFKVNELPVTNFNIKTVGETCKTSNNGKIEIKAAKALNYTATINGNGFFNVVSFRDLLEVSDLSAGNYSLCITVEGQKDYRQCYDLVIDEPKDLVVYAQANSEELKLILAGGDSFFIQVNGKKYTTSEKNFTIPLQKGVNNVTVSTDSQCQGVFTKAFIVQEKVLVYPNPFETILKISLPENSGNTKLTVRDLAGKIVYSGLTNDQQGSLQEIDLSQLIPGAYILSVLTENSETVHKLLKR